MFHLVDNVLRIFFLFGFLFYLCSCDSRFPQDNHSISSRNLSQYFEDATNKYFSFRNSTKDQAIDSTRIYYFVSIIDSKLFPVLDSELLMSDILSRGTQLDRQFRIDSSKYFQVKYVSLDWQRAFYDDVKRRVIASPDSLSALILLGEGDSEDMILFGGPHVTTFKIKI